MSQTLHKTKRKTKHKKISVHQMMSSYLSFFVLTFQTKQQQQNAQNRTKERKKKANKQNENKIKNEENIPRVNTEIVFFFLNFIPSLVSFFFFTVKNHVFFFHFSKYFVEV
jgi:ATP-dependent Zn protease